jgi:hypothetical protein
VVQQGSETVWHAGTATGSALGVGGFSFVPAHTPFRLRTGATETIVFASMDGKFDINVVPDERCSSGARNRSRTRTSVRDRVHESGMDPLSDEGQPGSHFDASHRFDVRQDAHVVSASTE